MTKLAKVAPTLVVTLTTDQLAELLEQANARALAKLAAEQQAEVLDLRECASLLKCTTKTVTSRVRERGLPCHYISPSDPRFRRSEVLAWLSAQTIERAAGKESA